MKPIKLSQNKLQKLESISIKGISYKFEKLHYDLTAVDFFEINGCKFENNNELTTICLLKTLYGFIDNKKFTYETLLKDLKLNEFLRFQDNVNFINECSLRINNKKYFNFVYQKSESIDSDFYPKFEDIFNEEIYKFDVDELLKTCIIEFYCKHDNYDIIPIYQFCGSNNYTTQIISVLEIVTNILIKAFPSFEVQIHNICSQELNKAELINSTLEDVSKLTKEEILELYNKQQKELELYKNKNKSISYEDLSKKYDNYMETSNSFREEFKRYNMILKKNL